MARLPQLADPVNLNGGRRVARLRAAFWAVEDALRSRALRRTGPSRRGTEPPATVRREPPAAGRGTDRVRVLRWVFSRGAERLTCELSLAADHSCYELRTTMPAARSVPVQRFTDVTAAFERQSAFEGTLLADGWTLDSYESATEERIEN